MIPKENQERPNTVTYYTCSTCDKHLNEGGSHGQRRWNFCPICGEQIEWDKVKPIVWKERNCDVCGGWLVRFHPAGFWYASSDYIGMDTCRTCWLEECLSTNCLSCTRGKYPDCKWLGLKKSYQEEDQ